MRRSAPRADHIRSPKTGKIGKKEMAEGGAREGDNATLAAMFARYSWC